ncbi:glycosyltransferase [Thermocrinis jamiesonii]|jgi:Glycosyltransferase|uniref:glycosyltransferase n=1 Tax=Thermocrinis jamiesonii TaxID=1302351 RepID=UPI00049517E7|nr:glycosyltransferase [Thermocrinis jamiesonii]
MLKVAHVVNTLSCGGAERVAINIYNCLKDKYENDFIIAKNIIKLSIDFIPKVIFNKKPPLPSFLYEKLLLYRLKETLKDYDIIISHLRDMNTRLSYLKSKNLIKSNLILVEHVTIECYSKKERRIIKNFYKYADLIIAVSDKVKDGLVKFFELDPSKIKVIYNGIDIKTINKLSEEYQPELKKPCIVSAGRLSDDKDFETLIKGVYYSKTKPYLYILGEGSKKSELENLIRNLKIEDKVFLVGFVKNPFPYIKNCDLYITSSIREAFPMSSLEAMALKKPIISTDVVPFAKHNFNSFVFKPKDYISLANYIDKLLSSEELRSFLSKNAYETAKEFSIESMCMQYRNLIQKIAIQ